MIQNCENYMNLSHIERIRFMVELIHVCQSDDDLFYDAAVLIDAGRAKGLFEGVKVLPELTENGK
jgi:hypothetical protein